MLFGALTPIVGVSVAVTCVRFAPIPHSLYSGEVSCVMGSKSVPGGGPLEHEKASWAILPDPLIAHDALPEC